MWDQGPGAVRVAAIGTAAPDTIMRQEDAEAGLLLHYGDRLSARSRLLVQKVFRHPSVRQRHFAIDVPEHMVDEDPDARIGRFTEQAVRLATQACRNALARAGAPVEAVRAVVVNTCTGYLCPGLATYLIETLPLARDTRVYDLVGHGCGGAVPNLELASRFLDGPDGVALSVSVEICTATFQMGDDISLIISNALFGDGAAAAVLRRGGEGPVIVDTARHYAPEFREDIRYVYRKGQLHNQLSVRLAEILKAVVPRLVNGLLAKHGLAKDQVRHWAIHPGGEKLIQAIEQGLALAPEHLRVTRDVLANYGNMSSPTVWFEMERILANGVAPGDWCVMVGMGAGLSAYVVLLRA